MITLFFVSFISATLLPMGSEAVLLYKVSQTPDLKYLLFLVATLGNTLGAVVNYLLGRFLTLFAIKKGYMKEESLKKAERYFDKYGIFALLLSWVPIIGDPITFVAGSMEYRFWKFLLLVTFAKGFRYAVLIWFINF